MKREANYIFCKIVAGEVPSFKLFEDATVLAFMDINPANEGHCLVIPKNHFETLYDAPAGEVGRVAEIATRVAKAVASVLKPEGLNLIQANGAAAAQSVMHFHMHVLPRRPGDDLKLNWGLKPGNREAIALLAEKLKARLA